MKPKGKKRPRAWHRTGVEDHKFKDAMKTLAIYFLKGSK